MAAVSARTNSSNRFGYRIILLPVAAALIACGDQPGRSNAPVVIERDSAGIRIVELSDPFSDVLPLWKVDGEPQLSIGERTGAPEYELFRVTGATRLRNGDFAVANSGTGELRIYDASGQHVRTLGRHGEGPGEFGTLAWVGLADADTIVAFDASHRRLTWFSSDGESVRTLSLEQAGAGGFPEPVGRFQGRMLVRTGFDRVFGAGERRDTVRLFLYDDAGIPTDTLGTYAGPERFFYRAPGGEFTTRFEPILGRDAHAHAAAGRVVTGSSDRFELDVYDGLALAMKVRSDVASAPLHPDEIEHWRNDLRMRQAELAEPFRQLMMAAIEVVPARRTPPAFAGLFVDSQRSIWVSRHPRLPGDPSYWVVLAADGTPRARVEIPAGLEIFEIGETYLLGVRRSDEGVERLEAYRLDRRL